MTVFKAMVLERYGEPLVMRERPLPEPGKNEIRVRVSACGVCRTDLHVIDGELPIVPLPVVPGHEIVGYVDKLGEGTQGFEHGERVGIPCSGKLAENVPIAGRVPKTYATNHSSPVTRATAAMRRMRSPMRITCSNSKAIGRIRILRRFSVPA